MPRFEQVLERHLQDSAFREYWERTAVARAVAHAVIAFRSKNGLSQRALAARLSWKPSQVARVELGEHNPSIDTLSHLARRLGVRFIVEVSPAGRRRVRPTKRDTVEEIEAPDGSHIRVLAS